jgi:hypothetical protein
MADETETETESSNRMELFAAILLGVAATLTAVSAFFSSAAGGEQLEAFNTSSAKLTDANFFFQRASQTQAAEQQLFISYLEAVQFDTETSFLTDLMSEDFEAAVQDWETSDDVFTPFDSELYVDEDEASAVALQEESDQALVDAEEAGGRGDKLDLSTVIFAAALFVGGILGGFRQTSLQRGLLGVGTVLTLLGTVVMLSGL